MSAWEGFLESQIREILRACARARETVQTLTRSDTSDYSAAGGAQTETEENPYCAVELEESTKEEKGREGRWKEVTVKGGGGNVMLRTSQESNKAEWTGLNETGREQMRTEPKWLTGSTNKVMGCHTAYS